AAVLPYLAYARQDSAGTHESLGLAWAGELLGAAGVQDIVCVDVHSEQARDILGLPVISLSPAAVLAGPLPAGWRDGVTFVAPDEGAQMRARALARAAGSNRPLVWARKRRTRGGIEHLGLEGSPADRAVVVDDILDTGATLLSCCAQLRRAGAREIAVVVTHGLFTQDRWRALSAEGVRAIWTTDTVVSRRRPPQTRIVSVAPLLAPVLGVADAPLNLEASPPPAAPPSGRS
ncbi:MAG TPA: ribose-phosphate diphosphokinase, partial [Solirubrobacteraceae bacterium]|nr:ribose-phosphate diphosphokinase [Solirubrobacteraceae bacterium]